MKKLLGTIISLCVIMSYSACNIINPDEQIPTYIRIDSFDLVSVSATTHGSVSENITDVWVYNGSQNIGNYELPATIPIIIEGDSADITLAAGIKANGQSFYRRRYTLYKPNIRMVGKAIGQTQNIVPKIEYRSTNTYYMIEDFENGNSFVSYTLPDTTITRMNMAPYVFEGNYSGLILLNDSVRGARSITIQSFKLPSDGKRESYLEIDYKCNIPFTIEVQLTSPGSSVIISDLLSINPRTDWNKIYISLTELANTYSTSDVNFIIKTSLSPAQNAGFVAIDNFKVLSQ